MKKLLNKSWRSISKGSTLIIIFFLAFSYNHCLAEKYKYEKKSSASSQQKTDNSGKRLMAAELCVPATGHTDLDLNNVRARINTGGDMWWDLQGISQYEIPKGSKKTSNFSAALWIAGTDVNGQIKCAAQRYRQVGLDYWTGPLTTDGAASIDALTCDEYDKHFPITRAEVDLFIAHFNNPGGYPDYEIPKSILTWPAHGDVSKGQSYYLAPYYDVSGSGHYDPENGDYPYYDINNSLCHTQISTPEGNPGSVLVDQVLHGDQTLWWIFNDKGNIHTESGGSAIGMEIRGQAFCYATNDEINNSTFYSYELINRSTFELTDTYFSQWMDTDIGAAYDDYVGCDVRRGLGYCYNGKEVDGKGEPWAYGANPPASGCVFFQGPYLDPDKCDNPSFAGTTDTIGPNFPDSIKCNIVTQNGSVVRMKYGPKKHRKDTLIKVRAEAINGVNFGNGIIDDERFGMRRFVYHSNSAPFPISDPEIAIQYYNYLRGIWKDNKRMLYGSDGHGPQAYGPECDFMFPAETDPCNWGTLGKPPQGPKNWTEESSNNPPGDRRFMESAGPFTLKAGAVNYITVGVPWARALSGGAYASVELLRTVTDKLQKLFDNCFTPLNGPNAPDLVIQERNRELIIYITNEKTSNNYNEKYTELDPTIITPKAFLDKGITFDQHYHFEGYQIFQLKDASASVADIHNPDLVRLAAQCDIKDFRKMINPSDSSTIIDNPNDPIDKLINYTLDESSGVQNGLIEVSGGNNGIQHTFDIKYDLFATGDKQLINNKQYYFLAIAYGYNEYMKYSLDPAGQLPYPHPGLLGSGIEGQKRPYLAGRKNISVVVGIPHNNSPEGTLTNSNFGDGPEITRIEGQGNGGNIIALKKETIDEILNSPEHRTVHPTYIKGKGPIAVKVIDPLTVIKGNFTLKFDSGENGGPINLSNCYWTLTNNDNGQIWPSEQSIQVANEQILLDLGLAITIQQVAQPGPTVNNTQLQPVHDGYINPSAFDKNFKEVEYQDSLRIWLSGIPNSDGNGLLWWIRSGTRTDVNNKENDAYDVFINPTTLQSGGTALDPDGYYTKLVVQTATVNFQEITGGTFAPYRLASKYSYGPAWNNPKVMAGITDADANKLSNLASVDLVLTPDKSKWTRSPVIEMQDDDPGANPARNSLSQGNVLKFNLRRHYSVDINGNDDGSNTLGMGWFPGYAINVETGERLNIIFGENSWLIGENGADMKFNPTANYNTPLGSVLWGGMHFIYIMGHNGNNHSLDMPAYDEGKYIYNKMKNLVKPGLNTASTDSMRYVYKDAMWVGLPMAIQGQEWLSNDVTIRLRVSKPYARYYSASGTGASVTQNSNYPMYSFGTGNIAAVTNNITVSKNALDLINVVPNPYYSYSTYEGNQIDTRIRITNLPGNCTITIYSINGNIIRQYKVDKTVVNSLKRSGDTDFKTSIDWDLKNHAGIPISSGVYLIDVNAPGLGERVIKWFGTIRPTDVQGL